MKKIYTTFESYISNISNIDETVMVYHGTDILFDKFDDSKMKDGWLGKGFYFTPDIKKAKKFGKYVKKCYLKINNPFIVKGQSPSDAYTEIKKLYKGYILSDDLSSILKMNKYDSVIFNHWDEGLYISVLSSKQILCVTK